ncbi:hypothetical protein [Pseudomonas saponiphila]|uniref:hypothetical protein n=1 Tax=Pseudomonas saponiphila TaxID=556534 RepID=UPI002240C9B3|nr:hypothetical protein [Pseudomonas saponiphila]
MLDIGGGTLDGPRGVVDEGAMTIVLRRVSVKVGYGVHCASFLLCTCTQAGVHLTRLGALEQAGQSLGKRMAGGPAAVFPYSAATRAVSGGNTSNFVIFSLQTVTLTCRYRSSASATAN